MITTFLNSLGQFFLTQWLWSVTWGMYHALFAFLFMAILLRYFLRINFLRSCTLSLGAQVWSLLLYSLFVIGILIIAVELRYVPESLEPIDKDTNFFVVAFNLGMIYSALQMLFFVLVNRWSSLNVRIAFLLSIISNVLAAWAIYVLLPIHM